MSSLPQPGVFLRLGEPAPVSATLGAMPQPYKGVRVKITTRVPPAVQAEAQRLADESNITLSDWLAAAIREKVERARPRSVA